MASKLHSDPNNSVTLVIPNFKKYGVNNYYNTSYFYIGEAKHCFYLTVYPHGFNERVKDFVSVWVRKYSKNEMLLDFKCCILNYQDEEFYEKSTKEHLTLESVLGWSTYCRRHMIVEERNKVLKDGKLTLKCTFVIYDDSAIPNVEAEYHDPFFKKSLLELSSNIHSLYTEGSFSDYSIRVDGQNFRVHKSILSARSPVFKDVFTKGACDISITDVSADVVIEMLNFIYTGRVVKMTVKKALSLYYLADKYKLLYLKHICSETLGSNLECGNVIDILLLAHKHADRELLDVCLCFTDKHLREIKGKKEWLQLMKSHPDLANRAIFFQMEE